jgi:MoaA/NifB/PqqE/SkfB family radical SAM enzyme
MYIQITSKCNMSCKHCGMNSKKKGEDMSLETFRNALKSGDKSITLGGGEPTMHPLFWQILGESIANSEYVWLATNGSNTEISIALAKIAQKGVIGCALSQDRFHDPIDHTVIDAFTRTDGHRNNDDHREIRNTEKNLIKAGRCKTGKEGCICEDIFVKPNGDVMACGCSDSVKLGNVNSDYEIATDWEYGTCYKQQPAINNKVP